MKRRTKLNCWLSVGVLFALGPLWGIIGTVLGMIVSFGALSQSPGSAETLSSNISLAMLTTVAGLLLCPVGVALIVTALIKLGQEPKNERPSSSVTGSR
ncbi:MAG: MotA/TolQ/ExbB proton channel family protein [Kiritimatiellae bacterium]|nr:MotA/TolQ/ExbB proton channel family protein [Kiritimatiellia bacterium]